MPVIVTISPDSLKKNTRQEQGRQSDKGEKKDKVGHKVCVCVCVCVCVSRKKWSGGCSSWAGLLSQGRSNLPHGPGQTDSPGWIMRKRHLASRKSMTLKASITRCWRLLGLIAWTHKEEINTTIYSGERETERELLSASPNVSLVFTSRLFNQHSIC